MRALDGQLAETALLENHTSHANYRLVRARSRGYSLTVAAVDFHSNTATAQPESQRMKSIFDRTAIPVLAAGLLAATACASHPVPNAKVASSEAAIRAAEETGAKDVPRAALHLKLAEEQLQSAKNLIQAEENERAEYVLARAQSDAELAIALSHTAESRDEASKALHEVKAVQSGEAPSRTP